MISYCDKKLQRCHCQKKLPSLLSSEQHFAGIFASEAMTLPEIDPMSFLVEHAQTFFAGEALTLLSTPRMCVRALSHVIYERQLVGIFLSLSSQVFL